MTGAVESAPATPQLVVDEHGLRRDVGRVGLLFAGVGSIIGSGWLFGALTASTIAGPAAIVSWLLGGVMVMLIGLCYAELGAMLPVSGGVVRYPHYAFVWWTLAIITLVAVAFFLATTHPGNLSDFGGFAPNGADSIFSAVATAGIVFSYLGFRQGVELAGESANPQAQRADRGDRLDRA